MAERRVLQKNKVLAPFPIFSINKRALKNRKIFKASLYFDAYPARPTTEAAYKNRLLH